MKAKSLFVLLVVLFCVAYVYIFCTLRAHGAEKRRPVVGPYMYSWIQIPAKLIVFGDEAPERDLDIIDWVETQRKMGWVPAGVPANAGRILFRKYLAPKPTPTETPYGESYK